MKARERVDANRNSAYRFHEMMLLSTRLSANSIAVEAYSNKFSLIPGSYSRLRGCRVSQSQL